MSISKNNVIQVYLNPSAPQDTNNYNSLVTFGIAKESDPYSLKPGKEKKKQPSGNPAFSVQIAPLGNQTPTGEVSLATSIPAHEQRVDCNSKYHHFAAPKKR